MTAFMQSFLAIPVLTALAAAQPLPVPAPHPPRVTLAAPAPPQVAWLAPPATAGSSYLGVGLVEIDGERAAKLGLAQPEGVEVTMIDPDSPAEEAGLERGDAILQFRGQQVVGVEHLVRLVRETPVGRSVAVVVWRDGSQTELTVEIGRRPPRKTGKFMWCEGDDCEIRLPDIHIPYFDIDIPRPSIVIHNRVLGAEVESVRGQLADYFGVEEGVLVRSVESNSPAERAGLRAGDVILSVDGKPVDDAGDVRKMLRAAEVGEPIGIEVMRNKSRTKLKVELEQRGPASRQGGFRSTRGGRL